MEPVEALIAGRYRILGVLGRGGMGCVYHCRDDALDAEWAVKEFVPPAGADAPGLVEQFATEARILARLRHPGLPRVAAFFEEGGRYYLVMDRIVGETLADRIERAGPVAAAPATAWLDEMLGILEYLHGQDPPVLFRDVSPGNLILGTNGRLHFIDFGLARLFVPAQATRPVLRGYGTTGFAPPEQYGRASTDARSDLYGVAATGYCMLTGETPPDALQRVLDGAALEIPPAVPPGLAAWIRRGMALKPEDRFSSAHAMRTALREAGRHGDESLPVLLDGFINRLGARLGGQWAAMPAAPPFVAGFTRRLSSAWVRPLDTLDEDEVDAALPQIRERVGQEPPLIPTTSFFILVGARCRNPHAVQAAAARHSSRRWGPRATLLVPVILSVGEVLDAHVPSSFINSNDLGDLLLNLRIAARNP